MWPNIQKYDLDTQAQKLTRDIEIDCLMKQKVKNSRPMFPPVSAESFFPVDGNCLNNVERKSCSPCKNNLSFMWIN